MGMMGPVKMMASMGKGKADPLKEELMETAMGAIELIVNAVYKILASTKQYSGSEFC